MAKDLNLDYELSGYQLYLGKRSIEVGNSLTYQQILEQVTTIFLSEEGKHTKYRLKMTQKARINMGDSRRTLIENIVELQNQRVRNSRELTRRL